MIFSGKTGARVRGPLALSVFASSYSYRLGYVLFSAGTPTAMAGYFQRVTVPAEDGFFWFVLLRLRIRDAGPSQLNRLLATAVMPHLHGCCSVSDRANLTSISQLVSAGTLEPQVVVFTKSPTRQDATAISQKLISTSFRDRRYCAEKQKTDSIRQKERNPYENKMHVSREDSELEKTSQLDDCFCDYSRCSICGGNWQPVSRDATATRAIWRDHGQNALGRQGDLTVPHSLEVGQSRSPTHRG